MVLFLLSTLPRANQKAPDIFGNFLWGYKEAGQSVDHQIDHRALLLLSPVTANKAE